MKHILRNLGKSTFVVLLICALAVAAKAQNTEPANLYEALKDQNISTQMKAQDLTADWHVITAGTTNLLLALTDSRDMPNQMYYYTNGVIFPFGKQRYLAVYHTRDKSDFQKRSQPEDDQNKGFLLKNAVLELSLLPLNDSQSIHEVKQFDPQTDFLSPETVAQDDSVSNLKQIGLALAMYTQDYDEKIPPMVAARSADDIQNVSSNVTEQTTVQSRLLPYVKDVKVFLQPQTHRPYLPNYKISGLGLGQIKTPPSETFTFYEDAPDSDGKRAVVYLDGHVARIDEEEFQRQRKVQGISESGYPPAMKPARRP